MYVCDTWKVLEGEKKTENDVIIYKNLKNNMIKEMNNMQEITNTLLSTTFSLNHVQTHACRLYSMVKLVSVLMGMIPPTLL